MTDTKAPADAGLVETLARTTVQVVKDHWGKMLGVLLTAATVWAGAKIGLPAMFSVAAPAPRVAVINAAPQAGSLLQKLDALNQRMLSIEDKVDQALAADAARKSRRTKINVAK